ncbi:hypothetical protein N7471_011911 [Penicillium samsonianum]|uniref:uncharacterized protein n=1 Tax=Penicillium samsonianum TaxID=1882272 RepID=UPI002546B235|nr:uncharacterized protein N7471_011911 [Penicillium samsonianum]KAJ6124594.1 hypothetical protein N7471_011911 [Penicillium samsonianum]
MMHLSRLSTVFVSLTAASAYSFEASNYHANNIIKRDVCVIGGGAAGAYAAVRLGDLGQSVVLVEKKDALGGQTEAYTVPSTGEIIDYGVENFQNTTLLRNFFSRFNVNLVPYLATATSTQYADFSTGTVYQNFSLPKPDFTEYMTQLEKYPYLADSWNLPNPVPEDLLLPFGEFITKYSLENIGYLLGMWGAGNGDILKQTTVYMLKSLDKAYMEGFQGSNVMAHENHAVYAAMQAHLGSNVLLSSTVVAASRPANGSSAKLVVRTPSGNKLIVAKKLLVAMPQTPKNMNPLSLDVTEKAVFDQFGYNAMYVGLVKGTGIGAFVDTLGIDISNSYDLPTLGGLMYLQSTTSEGVYRIWYNAETDVSEDVVKAESLAAIKRLTGKTAEFLVFGSHTPYQLSVAASAIENGFYNSLNALQGHRNTWYSGAAFLAHHTASLWNYTEVLLPKMIAA